VNKPRVGRVAEAIATLAYDGIVAFDRSEPEFDVFDTLHDAFANLDQLALLAVCSGTADYQLAGDAQQFWTTLETVALDHGALASQTDVRQIFAMFLERPVNANRTGQKRFRLARLFESGFVDWSLETYPDHDAETVWYRLADALETRRDRKTVVFAMKMYDLVAYVTTDRYTALPLDVPIPSIYRSAGSHARRG
jgi:N-glycosylase/DNA lyase